MSRHEIITRLTGHIGAVARRYPAAWAQLEAFRADRESLGGWPAWCHCPLAGAYAIVSGGGAGRVPPERGTDVAIVGALGAWRATQGIYEIDPTLLDALWDTDLEGEIPVDVLYRLPEWCVYVPTPGRRVGEIALHGFFAHLEHDVGDGRAELRLLLDAEGGSLLPVPLHVWVAGGLRAAVDRAAAEAEFQAATIGGVDGLDLTASRAASMSCAPLVSVVLYLCSRAAEMRDPKDSERRPRRPRPGERPAGAPTVWDVGYVIGPALRAALARQASEDRGGEHASPRPHVRRAHWHGYWLGPRDGAREFDLRWQPPIAVGIGEVLPTVRPVR